MVTSVLPEPDARIEELVEQLYDLNRRADRLWKASCLRLCLELLRHQAARSSSTPTIRATSWIPNWVGRVAKLGSRQGLETADREASPTRSRRSARLRQAIENLATEAGLADRRVPPHRRHTVQKGEREAREGQEGDDRGQPAAWSSRSPRSTPTAACSSSTSSRKATSA